MDLSKLSDEQLDSMILEKTQQKFSGGNNSQPQKVDVSSLSDEELNKMLFEKMMKSQNPQQELNKTRPIETDENDEADLGFIDRTKYSIDGIASNRTAFLVEKFGANNVRKDANGEDWVLQDNKWKPVNKDGPSIADGADFIGALPENAGTALGTMAGLGVGSLPLAMVGNGVGSMVRQGVSSLIGNPQVASASERVADVGLSSVMGLGGGLLGRGIKHLGKFSAPLVEKAFKNFNISKEGAKIAKIAKNQKIPSPTIGQLAGGYDLDLEKMKGARPFWGRTIRAKVKKQVEAVKNNLSKDFGEFVDQESSREVAGVRAKELANGAIDSIRKQSSNLFDKVSENGKDVLVDAEVFTKSLLKKFTEIGVFDLDGNPLEYSGELGMTSDQFKRLQKILGQTLKDIKTTAGRHGSENLIGDSSTIGNISATSINSFRKTLDANISEGKIDGLKDIRLVQMRNAFMDLTEDMLGAQNKSLKKDFRYARALWAKQLELRKIFKTGGEKGLGLENASDDKLLGKMFGDKKKVQMLKQLIGKEETEKAGKGYVNDLLIYRLGKEDNKSAIGLLNLIDKTGAIKEALSPKAYKNLRDNLFFMHKAGATINPSGTGIMNLMSDGFSPKGFATGAFQATATKTKENSKRITKGVLKFSDSKVLQDHAGQAGNLLTDRKQRKGADSTRNPRERKSINN